MDADTDAVKAEHINEHKKDNKSILALLGYNDEPEWPTDHIWKQDLIVWKHNLTELINLEIGQEWKNYVDAAAAHYGNPGGLQKNPLAISRALESAWEAGHKSPSLERVAECIITFTENAIAL